MKRFSVMGNPCIESLARAFKSLLNRMTVRRTSGCSAQFSLRQRGHSQGALNSFGLVAAERADKLNLGCGSTIMPDWLNADLIHTDSAPPETWKHRHEIYILDATETFPFSEEKFKYIYCEDFMEHFDQKEGLSICAECFRILKPGGVWRISTPNFDYILGTLKLQGRAQIEFGHWHWGHKLIYTEQYLKTVLNQCGFDSIVRCKFGESKQEVLKGVDSRLNQAHMNLILEAVKPLEARG